MSDQTKLKPLAPVPTVEVIESLGTADLNDLCDATDAAIEGGGGFGWVHLPARDMMERYWQGVLAMPARILLAARLDGVICGTCQLWKPPAHNEAQAHIVTLTTNFVAPWARGHGLAKMLVEKAEEVARAEGFAVINLEVRETMSRAIEIYEALGYVRFGMHPYSVRLPDQILKGYYYYKVIDPSVVEQQS
ncbi:MAG TPA: GNAT family N-acetyltransferase [Alphaproteobacteria bacterium]|nr:GNAT family N-acetyltransferase [Alphaproteobacteria bacterium]USO05228.1 MAG: GNAT family N-acetyltransferase [Rhodospirillales bacterium]HOO81003.1 GNAT family N-acetyltransferase [Alphaproteobacteria bacterium]